MGPTKTLETKSPDSAVGEGSYFEDLSIQIPNSCRHFKQTAMVKPSQGESPDLSPMSPEQNRRRLISPNSPPRLIMKN